MTVGRKGLLPFNSARIFKIMLLQTQSYSRDFCQFWKKEIFCGGEGPPPPFAISLL